MPPLTKDVQRSKTLHQLRLTPVPVKAGEVIFEGALTCVQDADGLAVPGADAAGLTFVGVAYRGFDNTDGADGVVDGLSSKRYAELDNNGPWSYAVAGTAPNRAGQPVFIVDDNTVSVDATVNNVKCGETVEPDPDGSGNWLIDIEKA